MTRGKKLKKKDSRRRETLRRLPLGNDEMTFDEKLVSISSTFKNDEMQEIRNILKVNNPGNEHTLVGAVVVGKFDVVKKLLKDGFPINYTIEGGLSALIWAIKVKQTEMIDLLMNRGAEVLQEDQEGNNAIMHALQAANWDQDMFIDFWHVLKEEKIDLDHPNKTGNTLLHFAVKRQWVNVIELFLDVGANVNSMTNKGATPLMLASCKHHIRTVQILLEHNADLTIEDQNCCTALCYAMAYMIQRRFERPSTVLETLINLVSHNNAKMTLESYLKRRLELLTAEENTSHTITTVIIHIITYFMRFIRKGASMLIQANIFKIVKEAMDKHIEDGEYIFGLANILIETLRHCDCCMSHANKDNVFAAFMDADIPNTCLRVLKRSGTMASFSNVIHPLFLPLALTCSEDSVKFWLQQNFKQYAHFCRRSSHSPNYNYFPDDKHSQMVRKSSLELKSLLARLQKGDTIYTDKAKHKKRKLEQKKDANTSSAKKVEETFLKKDAKPRISETSLKIVPSSAAERAQKEIEPDPNEEGINDSLPKQDSVETYWPLKKIEYEEEKGNSQEQAISPKYSGWRDEFKEGCQLFGITDDEPEVRIKTEIDLDWAESSHDTSMDGQYIATSQQLDVSLQRLDDQFNDTTGKLEELWQNDFDGGYESAEASPEDVLELMSVLPDIEAHCLDVLTTKWRVLLKQVKIFWQKHKGEKKLPLAEIRHELVLLCELLKKKENCKENGAGDRVGILSIIECLKRLSDVGDDESSKVQTTPPRGSRRPTMQELLTMSSNMSGDVCEAERDYNVVIQRCQTETSPEQGTGDVLESHLPIPPPGFGQKPINTKPAKVLQQSLKKDRLNLYSSWRHSELVKSLRGLPLEQCHVLAEDDLIMAVEEYQHLFKISSGGNFGNVVIGLDVGSYPVAVKQILRTSSMTSQILVMRVKELLLGSGTLLGLRNENLVPYSHCSDLGNRLILATPLCENNLCDHIFMLKRKNALDINHATLMVKQVLLGLHFLHSQTPSPVIHGNLKPSNVLVDTNGNLRLSEFGLQKVLYQQIAPSPASVIWWAHETWTHYHSTWQLMVTLESDIQVCGMMVHYIVTGGLHAFGTGTTEEMLEAIGIGCPQLRCIQPEATDLVAWMIAHQPINRPLVEHTLRHVFLWGPAKKWKFILLCAGVSTNDAPLSFAVDEFHRYLDIKASAHHIHTRWIGAVKGQLRGLIACRLDDYPDRLSGLLRLVRNTLPSCSGWFMQLFPCITLTLFRLLENTFWMLNKDFAPFEKMAS